jgi:hypothetical protein
VNLVYIISACRLSEQLVRLVMPPPSCTVTLGATLSSSLLPARWTETGSGPEVLRVDDFDRLRDTESLFARKFDQGVDGRVLELIEEHLL